MPHFLLASQSTVDGSEGGKRSGPLPDWAMGSTEIMSGLMSKETGSFCGSVIEHHDAERGGFLNDLLGMGGRPNTRGSTVSEQGNTSGLFLTRTRSGDSSSSEAAGRGQEGKQ